MDLALRPHRGGTVLGLGIVSLVAVMAVFVATACASRGPNFRMEDAQRVKIGMTQNEVVQILGSKPSDVHVTAGSELWMWIHVVVTAVGSESKSFAVKFVDGKAVWIQR